MVSPTNVTNVTTENLRQLVFSSTIIQHNLIITIQRR